MGNNGRFVIETRQGNDFSMSYKVIVDRETGVNYLFVNYGYSGGLTPLLDSEGKPVVTEYITSSHND